MRVTVLLFASARELAGCSTVQLDAPEGASCADALSLLFARFPPLAQLRDALQVAVNQKYAAPETILKDGDEFACAPPLTSHPPLLLLTPLATQPHPTHLWRVRWRRRARS